VSPRLCEYSLAEERSRTTVTETITSLSHVTSTITAYTTYYTSSTVFTTKYTTFIKTASNVDTATDVKYTTITPAPKARRTVDDYYALATKTQGIDIERDDLSVSASTVDAQAPIITVYAHPQFDVVAQNLGKLGVVVKRQNTITSTITITTSAVTTDFSTVYSDITSVDSVVSTILSTITSTIFIDAATTVQVTSTITAGLSPATDTTTSADGGAGTGNSDTQQQSSTGDGGDGGDGGGGLSTAEKAGIGVGAGAGAIIIMVIIAALWRRSKKNKKEQHAAHPTAYAAVGAFSPDKEQYGDRPPYEQRESYMSNTSSVMGGAGAAPYYYRSVSPRDPDAPGRTTHEMAENNRTGFQYQPYELYEEGHHPYELDARNREI
jgi:hypothetical protein